ncbi:Iron-sulfur cluster assembly protein SufD [Patulibacter medicamentivorans]|jgi:Fe-S cluster assembly protein SufD|uniref:Iron-sulfur cluster assembly protein SufD n=1 Tax=Patulibacter medicamentivorans TaxID=1097667 RepID=H0EBS8_9ACTN|nr:Fe-S cluster assembly protein SufD [Patulibacter medicamentivorans]EHN08876.1 Iron-sulfur cluster assembly protein SufD [Patulibacter medicamentivorans]
MTTTTSPDPTWLTERRDAARAELLTLELPSFRDVPGWEFTEIPELDLDAYPAPDAVSADQDAAAVAAATPVFDHLPEGTVTITQIDDRTFGGERAEAVSEGPLVLPLEVAAERHPDLVEPYLGKIETQRTPFTARNDSDWRGGFFVHVPRNTHLEAPVLLTLIQAQAGRAASPRTLIVLEEGAEAEVWSQAVSTSPELEALVNGVVEIHVGANARLRFVDVQDLSEKTWIFGAQRATIDRDGWIDWITLGLGSAKGKVFQETSLDGPGAHGRVTGGYATHGKQHLDFDTLQTHMAPNTTSDLAFRGVLAEKSSTVWRGMIKVDEAGQQTDAFQESRNLLLGRKAHADAIPGLEIAANDVRCTHAAAIAQIDPEQVFYLRSHGLPEGRAKRLVIEGFMAELVTRFEEGPVREALGEVLHRRLEAVLG